VTQAERLVADPRLRRRAALLFVHCPNWHPLGWVLPGPTFVGLTPHVEAPRRAPSERFVASLDGTAVAWGVGCACCVREIRREWLMEQLRAGVREAEAPAAVLSPAKT